MRGGRAATIRGMSNDENSPETQDVPPQEPGHGAVPEIGQQQIPAALQNGHGPHISAATCLLGRLQWMARHAPHLETARLAACAAAGLDPADPRAPAIDPVPFLPPHLRPGAVPDGLPGMNPKVTTVGGTDVCAQHHPAAPQGDTGRKAFMIAHTPLTSALVAEALGRQG
jgi:hypothetical protein